MLNLYTLPASELYLEVEPGSRADWLALVLRTANFTHAAAGQAYLANDHYAAIYRLTPRTARTLNALDTPAWRNLESTNEWELIAQRAPGWNVTNALDQMEQAIVSSIPHTEVKTFTSTRWFVDSREVLADQPASPAYRKFAAGESSDTTYLRSATESGVATNFTLGPNEAIVVYGVDHAASGLVTYANFAIYGDWVMSPCTSTRRDPEWLPVRLWRPGLEWRSRAEQPLLHRQRRALPARRPYRHQSALRSDGRARAHCRAERRGAPVDLELWNSRSRQGS